MINQIVNIPQSTDARPAFNTKTDALFPQLNSAFAQFNTEVTNLNSLSTASLDAANIAQSARDIALSTANYKGLWSGLSGALNIPASVFHNENFWILKANLANVALATPGISSSWEPSNGSIGVRPNVRPSLLLDFANSQKIDSRITFARVSTATRFNDKGLLEIVPNGIPRIDFEPNSKKCLGLLLEAASTNLTLYSEQLENVAWVTGAITVTPNVGLDPYATSLLDLLVPSVPSAEHYIQQSYIATAGEKTLSCYALAGSAGYKLRLRIFGVSDATAYFDLSNGSVSLSSGTSFLSAKSKYIGNGLYRFSLTFNGNVGATSYRIQVVDSANTVIFSGDGVNGIYAGLVQLESYGDVSSYIPTTSTTVTRSLDTASMTGSNFSKWFNPKRGTMLIKASLPCSSNVSGASVLATISDGTFNNGLDIVRAANSMLINIECYTSGTSQLSSSLLGTAINETQFLAGLAYATNDVAGDSSLDIQISDNSVTLPAVNSLFLGAGRANNINANIHIANFSYYQERLSNSELNSITSM